MKLFLIDEYLQITVISMLIIGISLPKLIFAENPGLENVEPVPKRTNILCPEVEKTWVALLVDNDPVSIFIFVV